MSAISQWVTRTCRPIDVRRLFAIFAALAVMLAPLSITQASAAVPGHAAMMDQMGHCGMPASGSTSHDRMAGKICCVALNMAVSIAPPAPLLVERSRRVAISLAIPEFHASFLGEIATPPPRRS